MNRDTDALIGELVGNLQPVRPMKFSTGLGLTLAGLVAMLAIVGAILGLRPDVLTGDPSPIFVLASGLFFLLGLAASVTVVTMGRPRVGSDHDGWKWAAAMTALLPLAAIVSGIERSQFGLTGAAAASGMDCLTMGIAFGLATFGVLVMWLRKGAPTSPERAGLLAGVAAGSFGIFAFSFHCPLNDIVHIGIWHGGAVVISALIGRIAVPRIVRW
ncbi:MAG: DUF1109 domain-containing protein [Sphingomonadales bacterium]|nr:DUF1109 domain-containing protein [Sphingomonadales bacterium]MDE2568006.1 DUF1109 domain-containing protein [Sphingomonadales bacterium]